MAKATTYTYEFDKIDGVIVQIEKDGKTLRQKIHNAAVCIMKHWHDNPSEGAICAEKMTALSGVAGYHAKALGDWIQSSSPMKLSDENKAYYVHVDDKLMGKAFMHLRDTPFWEVSPPSQPQPMSIFEEIEKLIEKAQRRIKKPVEGDEINPEVVRKLRSIKSEMQA